MSPCSFAFSAILQKSLDLHSLTNGLLATNLSGPCLLCRVGRTNIKAARKEPAVIGKDRRDLWEIRRWRAVTQNSGDRSIRGSDFALHSVNFSLTREKIPAAIEYLQFKEQEPNGVENVFCVGRMHSVNAHSRDVVQYTWEHFNGPGPLCCNFSSFLLFPLPY